MSYWYMQQLGWVWSEKKPLLKGYILYDSLYIVFLRYQNYRDEEQSGVCQELEIRETGVSDYKGSSWWQNSSVSWLWWWLHESIHVIKEHRIIHRHCTYVNFLAFIWNYNYVQCNHWGRLGEGQLPMSIIISK